MTALAAVDWPLKAIRPEVSLAALAVKWAEPAVELSLKTIMPPL